MKINRLIIFLFACAILSGIMTGAFILEAERRAVPDPINQNKALRNDNYVAASISEGTIFLLLAVGVVGVLGVSRKKKDSGSDSHRNPTDREGEEVTVTEDRKKLMSRNT